MAKNKDSHRKAKHIEFLERLTDDSLPVFIESLSAEHTEVIHSWVSNILEKDRAGVDRLFESMTQTIKYIPNFILVAITHKYIEPPIAARITAKLKLKQSVGIASGLPAAYIGETAVYLENEYASILLSALPKKQAKKIVEFLFESYPLKVLDIFVYADSNLFKLAKPPMAFLKIDQTLLSDQRREVFVRFE
jgi:hypothetical protein